MKTIRYFYLEDCPHCKRATAFLREFQQEIPAFADVPLEMIEESRNPELAAQHDYYYVPCFYVGGQKLHEGVAVRSDVLRVLEAAAEI